VTVRCWFKYGFGEEFIEVFKMLYKFGLDFMSLVRVGGVEVSFWDVVVVCLFDLV